MKVTRDVILDLWPVYEEGEASADTRALVDAFLEEDPEFARLIREERRELMTQTASVALPPDGERAALLATHRLLTRRMQFLALGLLFTVMALFMRIPGLPRVGGFQVGRFLLLGIGVAGWVGLFLTHRRLRGKGL